MKELPDLKFKEPTSRASKYDQSLVRKIKGLLYDKSIGVSSKNLHVFLERHMSLITYTLQSSTINPFRCQANP